MKGHLMTEPNKPAGQASAPATHETGPVPDRPASHPPGPQDRPEQTGQKRAPGSVAPAGAGSRGPTPEQQRRDVEAASAAPGERRAVSRGRASESGDPDAHQALADLQGARLNLADAEGGAGRDARVADAQQAVKDAEERLAGLGYE